MQELLGNQGTAQLLQRIPGSLDDPTRPMPTWHDDEHVVRRIQARLRSLGLYRLSPDGRYGAGTDAALVEAYGGDAFRTREPSGVLGDLARARVDTPRGDRGEHRLRYGELFRDGLLEITVGVGFEEAAADAGGLDRFVQEMRTELTELGFVADEEVARRVFAAAGRQAPRDEATQLLVKQDALTYQPPIGDARHVSAAVRFVSNADGEHGAAAARSFREGMGSSDVTFYGGHGRYGTGPDFDRNFGTFTLRTDAGTESFRDYHRLEERLEPLADAEGRTAFEQFVAMHASGAIRVDLSNAGNLYLRSQEDHASEFGSRLIRWALAQGGGRPETGAGGALEQSAEQDHSRRYRVLAFDGCRTRDYSDDLRATPGFDTRSADLLVSRRRLARDDIPASLSAFLEGILRQRTAEDILREVNSEQVGGGGPGFVMTPSRFDPLLSVDARRR